jgi:hypothetical protein
LVRRSLASYVESLLLLGVASVPTCSTILEKSVFIINQDVRGGDRNGNQSGAATIFLVGNWIELNRFAGSKEAIKYFFIDVRRSSTYAGVTIAVARLFADIWMDQPALQYSFSHKPRFLQYSG